MEPNAPVPNHSEVPVESYDRSAHGTGPATLTPPPAQERGRPPRRHRPRWFVWLIGTLLGIVLLVLLVCALIGGLVMGIAIKLANEVTASTTSTQTFAITGTPSLNIHNASGR
ncbi:MAG TPA: hypothetical protein VFU63_13650, partial [Ktedonobacterales bacterium]|nr:hypothetical protein [Ktedonobacterales bacterium]